MPLARLEVLPESDDFSAGSFVSSSIYAHRMNHSQDSHKRRVTASGQMYNYLNACDEGIQQTDQVYQRKPPWQRKNF